MMKKLFFITILSILLGSFYSCNKEEFPTKENLKGRWVENDYIKGQYPYHEMIFEENIWYNYYVEKNMNIDSLKETNKFYYTLNDNDEIFYFWKDTSVVDKREIKFNKLKKQLIMSRGVYAQPAYGVPLPEYMTFKKIKK